jgi:hypothetical protein
MEGGAMVEDQLAQSFQERIEKDIRKYGRLRTANQWAYKLFSLGAILSSFGSVVVTATAPDYKMAIIALSGLPAVLLSIVQTLDFYMKSLYFDVAATKLDEIYLAVRFQGIPPAEATERWLKVSEELRI